MPSHNLLIIIFAGLLPTVFSAAKFPFFRNGKRKSNNLHLPYSLQIQSTVSRSILSFSDNERRHGHHPDLFSLQGGAGDQISEDLQLPILPLSCEETEDSVSFLTRGGAKPLPDEPASPRKTIAGIPQDKLIIGGVTLAILGALVYHYREPLKPLLDRHALQERTLSILRELEQSPNSLPIYMAGMAVWEFLGLSTIPVETAAGMVFGLRNGIIASGTGKLMGAYLAFGLGRGFLSNFVRQKLQQNPVWCILNKSTDVHPPLTVAMLMKFSCFPEFIKNFGSSCLDMSFATFAFATMSHGLFYTALWTWLGTDAAMRLERPLAPANMPLQVALVVAAMIGLVGSPLLMAWWVRDMKRIQNMEQGKS